MHSIATKLSVVVYIALPQSFVITDVTIISVSLVNVVVLVIANASHRQCQPSQVLHEAIMSTQGSNNAISLQRPLVQSSAQVVAASVFQFPFHQLFHQ